MTTALAIRPKEHVIQFRRCTGHCCDPVTLGDPPGVFRRLACRGAVGDARWIYDNLVYLGWRPPSMGGWATGGTFLYRCPHFDRSVRRCIIYGQGKRPLMCRSHPTYDYGPWETCTHEGCTRRTMVLTPYENHKLRRRFSDLWELDLRRWEAWEREACRPEYGPEAMPEWSEE